MDNLAIAADKKRRESRRIVRIAFSYHCPLWILKKAFELLPDDTMLVTCGTEDYINGRSAMIFHSSKFKECPESMALPVLIIEADNEGKVWLKEYKSEQEEWVKCQYK